MQKTWILAAHRGGAKFYEHTTPGSLRLVQEIDHPIGRLHNRDLVSDGPGRIGYEGGNVAMATPQVDRVREEAQRFARSLAEALAAARVARSFERLILVAEPHFLGLLRAALDGPTASTVMGSVANELTAAPPQVVKQHLANLLVM